MIIYNLDNLYQIVKQEFRKIESGQQLTITIRYGNEYNNEGQFFRSFSVVKSKGRFRNPNNYKKDWTLKGITEELIKWSKHLHSITFEIY